MTYDELDKIKNEINSNMSPIYGISVNAYPAYHYMTYDSEFFTITMGLYNGHIDIQFNNFNVVTRNEHLYKFVKACIELVETPIEERISEKKYYLKHRYLQSSLTNSNDILCYSVSDDKLALCNGINFPKYKTYLTLEEIEEIKEKFDTDLTDFELVEVVDEKM